MGFTYSNGTNTVITGYTGTLPDNLVFLASLTIIGWSAFDNCTGITSVTFPASLTSIGIQAFNGCTGITSVTFPVNSSLTSIGAGAFAGCTGITSVTFPASLTGIGWSAFGYCGGLTTVTFLGTPTSLDADIFKDSSNLTTINVPSNWTGPASFNNGTSSVAVTRASGGGGGGGAAGDPYVSTIAGKIYKLPAFNGALRLYQGQVGAQQLTINATTRIDDDKQAMDADSAAMNGRLATPVSQNLEMVEAMSFFDRVHVQLGDAHAVFSLYDGFCTESPLPAGWKLHDKGTLQQYLKDMPFYAHLAGSVCELSPCDGVTIRMGIVPIRHIRSTIEVVAPNMSAGNGALVHRLSHKQMALRKLSDLKPVAKKDAAVKRTIRETFVCDKQRVTADIAFLG